MCKAMSFHEPLKEFHHAAALSDPAPGWLRLRSRGAFAESSARRLTALGDDLGGQPSGPQFGRARHPAFERDTRGVTAYAGQRFLPEVQRPWTAGARRGRFAQRSPNGR